MNKATIEEYQEWLSERTEQLEDIYNQIFEDIIKVDCFDSLIKELGNPLFDFDSMILGLHEYKNQLKEYLKERADKNEKKKVTFKFVRDE
jgi:hypothetical protein